MLRRSEQTLCTVTSVLLALYGALALGVIGPGTTSWLRSQRFEDFGRALPAATEFCLDFRVAWFAGSVVLLGAGIVATRSLRSALPGLMAFLLHLPLLGFWIFAMGLPVRASY